MSDVSRLFDDLIAAIHGKKRQGRISADAHKLLEDLEKVVAGLVEAGPYAPAILSDVAAITAEASAIVASKGLDLPEFLAAGAALKSLAANLAKAETAFVTAMANYRMAAAVVVGAPSTQTPVSKRTRVVVTPIG